jgi:hypothetical protein
MVQRNEGAITREEANIFIFFEENSVLYVWCWKGGKGFDPRSDYLSRCVWGPRGQLGLSLEDRRIPARSDDDKEGSVSLWKEGKGN